MTSNWKHIFSARKHIKTKSLCVPLHLPVSLLVYGNSTPLQTLAKNRPLSQPLWETIGRGLLSWLQTARMSLNTSHFDCSHWVQQSAWAEHGMDHMNHTQQLYPHGVSFPCCQILILWVGGRHEPLTHHPPVPVFGYMGMIPNDQPCFTVNMTRVSSASVFTHFIKILKNCIITF